MVFNRNVLRVVFILACEPLLCLKAYELRGDGDVPALSLVFLDRPDIVNSSLYTKWLDILDKLACFELGVVKNVLNVHQQQV